MASDINSYVSEVQNLDDETYEKIWQEAVEYNQSVPARHGSFALTERMREKYNQCLNPGGDGVMGYIEIPKINLSIPIHHGTEDDVLQSAVGHIDWSSLPTGGPGTHCVLSGHRGLPTAKLFTDLDLLKEEDIFTLNILNEVLTYEVDQIRTVEPEDLEFLAVEEGKDYCTLVTCTPYGINTHRLLVRGHRIENLYGDAQVVSEVVQIDPLLVAVVLAIPILFALFMMVMLKKPENKNGPAQTAAAETPGPRKKETPVFSVQKGKEIINRLITKVSALGQYVKNKKH